MSISKFKYFPNLTSLRFFASFAVIIHHIEGEKWRVKIEHNSWDLPQIKLLGALGVDFFFVLSGFLITYLLLIEKKRTGNINVIYFYKKRILRIWPLYFIILLLGLIVLPILSYQFNWNLDWDDYNVFNILLLIFLAANFALAYFGPTIAIAHTWSVATEEQFYIIWPLLFKFFKNRLWLMLLVIFGHLFVKVVLYFLINSYGFLLLKNFNSYWSMFRVELMGIGGIMSLFLFEERYNTVLSFLLQFKTFIFVSFTIVALFLIGFENRIVIHETYGVLFGIFILNMAANPKLKYILENRIFLFLGNISYGLYMFHPVILFISFTVMPLEWINNDIFIYTFVIITTILSATISYYFIELKFIKLKHRIINRN